MKLFWNFKNKLLSGARSHQFEFSGQVNEKVMTENLSQLNAPVLMTEPP